MLYLATALALAQGTAQGPFRPQDPYSPEIEAIQQHRDETRQQAATPTQAQVLQQRAIRRAQAPLPPKIEQRLGACLAKADKSAQDGLADAAQWAAQDGGGYAAQCKGYALGKEAQWAASAAAFESGAQTPGVDKPGQARLWTQAGNAALAGNDAPRALQDFDRAFADEQPPTRETGEAHLDRARARVATGDLKGARSDLDAAVNMAPDDSLGWLLSATLARRMNDLPLARQHIEEAAKRAPGDSSVALEQGVIDALSGDRDPAARAAFERAAQLAPGSDTARKAKAYLAELGPASGDKAEATPAKPAP